MSFRETIVQTYFFDSPFFRTRFTTTRDRNQQRGNFSTGFLKFSPVEFFPYSPGFLCELVMKSPEIVEKIARSPGEERAQNPVTSVAVMVFGGPNLPNQRAANGGSDPSWLNLAFLGRPDFPSRGPQTRKK